MPSLPDEVTNSAGMVPSAPHDTYKLPSQFANDPAAQRAMRHRARSYSEIASNSAPTLTTDEVVTFRHNAIANGWTLVAIRTGDKVPVGAEWQKGQSVSSLLSPKQDGLNTGALCRGLRVIDVDINDPAMAAAIRELVKMHLPAGAPIRVREGTARFQVLYKASEGTPGKQVISGEMDLPGPAARRSG